VSCVEWLVVREALEEPTEGGGVDVYVVIHFDDELAAGREGGREGRSFLRGSLW